MLNLRKFLCGCFGFFALSFLTLPILSVVIAFSSLSRYKSDQPIVGYVLLVVFSLVLAVTLPPPNVSLSKLF